MEFLNTGETLTWTYSNLYTLKQRTVLFYTDIILLEGVNTNETAREERSICPAG